MIMQGGAAPTLHCTAAMRATTTISIGAGLLLLAAGCAHQVHAEAKSDDKGAHAEVKAPDDGDANRYDAKKLTRSGVQLDPELTKSCKLDEREAFFAFDSAEISEGVHAVLAKVATCVTDGPLKGRELELVGHADPQGSDEYNKELGLSRAESVAACLRDHGVTESKIEINSLGEEGTDASDPSEWPMDRKVEIRVKSPAASASR